MMNLCLKANSWTFTLAWKEAQTPNLPLHVSILLYTLLWLQPRPTVGGRVMSNYRCLNYKTAWSLPHKRTVVKSCQAPLRGRVGRWSSVITNSNHGEEECNKAHASSSRSCSLLHTFTELISYSSRCRSPYLPSLIMQTKKAPICVLDPTDAASFILLRSGYTRGKKWQLVKLPHPPPLNI